MVAVFATVQSINETHELHKSNDKMLKFRAFICAGLNAGCLDSWFEVLALAASSPPCASMYKPSVHPPKR
jgi:hypothetical protein